MRRGHDAREPRPNPYPLYQPVPRDRPDAPRRSRDSGRSRATTTSSPSFATTGSRPTRATPQPSTSCAKRRKTRARSDKVAGRVLLFTDPPDHTTDADARQQGLHASHRREAPGAHHRARRRSARRSSRTRGEMDVIEDFAYPLPALVICELMGVPTSDRDMFRGWSGEVAPILDPSADPRSPREGDARRSDKFALLLHGAHRRATEGPTATISCRALIAAEEQRGSSSRPKSSSDCAS